MFNHNFSTPIPQSHFHCSEKRVYLFFSIELTFLTFSDPCPCNAMSMIFLASFLFFSFSLCIVRLVVPLKNDLLTFKYSKRDCEEFFFLNSMNSFLKDAFCSIFHSHNYWF